MKTSTQSLKAKFSHWQATPLAAYMNYGGRMAKPKGKTSGKLTQYGSRKTAGLSMQKSRRTL